MTDFQCENFPLDRTLLFSWTVFPYIPFFIQQWKILLRKKNLVCHLERQQSTKQDLLVHTCKEPAQHSLSAENHCDPGSEMPGKWAQGEIKDVLWKEAILAFAFLHPHPVHTPQNEHITWQGQAETTSFHWKPSLVSPPKGWSPNTHLCSIRLLCSPGFSTTQQMVTGLELNSSLMEFCTITTPSFKHSSSYFGINMQMSQPGS